MHSHRLPGISIYKCEQCVFVDRVEILIKKLCKMNWKNYILKHVNKANIRHEIINENRFCIIFPCALMIPTGKRGND